MSESSARRVFAHIADQIEARIASGEFAIGQKLPSERQLAADFSTSRNSVREAILLLQSRGLLAKEDRARTRVARPSSRGMLDQLSSAARTLLGGPDGVANLQEARALFECGLARHAAKHASPKQIDRLELALAQNRQSIGDMEAFIQTDMAFHLTIAQIPDNPIFVALHEAFDQWLVMQRTVGIGKRGSARVVYRDHEAIFNAIASGDVEAADAAMAEHLAKGVRSFWQASATNCTD